MEKQRAKILDLLDGYEIPKEHKNEKGEPIVGKSFFSRSLTGSMTGKKGLSSNVLFDALRLILNRFLSTSVRVYGTMLLIFGATSTLISLATDYFAAGESSSLALIAGLVLASVGIALTFAESSIGTFAEKFFLTDYLLFEFFCIKRMQKSSERKGFPPAFAIIAGVLLGALGMFFHPLRVVVILCLLLFVVLSFASPEFSFLFTLIALPYTGFMANSTYILAGLALITFLSFLRKVISGKRVYVFEKYDFLIGFMIIFVLISGIFIKGLESFESSVIFLIGAFGYILASNLVTNRRLSDRVSSAVVYSSLPASLYVAASFFAKAGGEAYKYRGEGFYSTAVFGAYIAVAMLFTLSLLKEAKHGYERSLYIFIFASQLVALVLTASFLAAAALLLSIVCYFLLKTRKFPWLLAFALIASVYLVFLLPDKILSSKAMTLILGREIGELKAIWRVSFDMFSESPFTGIGMGAEAYAEEIAKHGALSFENSSNIFLELACEAGVFALLFFVLALAECLRHRSRYRSYVRVSQVKTVSVAAHTALVALIIYGSVHYIWESSALCYLFWCIFGLGSAALRISKRECDNRIIYYNDVVSPESSDIDVQIDGFDDFI